MPARATTSGVLISPFTSHASAIANHRPHRLAKLEPRLRTLQQIMIELAAANAEARHSG